MKYITMWEGRVDLLPLVPQNTVSGFEIKLERFNYNNEEWVRSFYGADKRPELKIKRFVSCIALGKLLGQMQAEGTKSGKKDKLEFSNELIAEHKDFITCLEELGINKKELTFKLINSGSLNERELETYARKFGKEIGFYPKIYNYSSKRGGFGFKTIFYSTLLTQLILNSMDIVRKLIANSEEHIINNQGLKVLANAFLEKLLTGDGTLNIDKRCPVPRISIRIKDQNLDYLEDYKKILEVLGFKGVRIFYKHITVRAMCSFDNLLYLYKINAFKNTDNWNKLLISIGLCLEGRRLRTKLRFLDLENFQQFTAKYVAIRYNLHPNNRKWLINSMKDGYIKCVSRKPPYEYQFTEKAKRLITILKIWKNDLAALIKLKKITDLRQLLGSIKTKKDSTK